MPIKLHENLDPNEVTKRRLAKEEAAEGEVPHPPGQPRTMSQSQFGKPYSAAEREMHQKALAKLLREGR